MKFYVINYVYIFRLIYVLFVYMLAEAKLKYALLCQKLYEPFMIFPLTGL